MNKLSHLFGRTRGAGDPEGMGPDPLSRDGSGHFVESFSDVGARMGEENEALRNLLVDAEHKMLQLNEVMEAFGKIVTPINRTIRALEQEKSKTIGLASALDEGRAAYDTLRAEYYDVEKKAAAYERDNERLREELDGAQHVGRSLEATRAELATELATYRAENTNLRRELAQETSHRQTLAEENQTLTAQAASANKQILHLESELASAREKLVLLEDEGRSLQASFDQALSEGSRLSRALADRDALIGSTQNRLAHAETAAAELHAERNKLQAGLAEANERYRVENHALNTRVAALQSRAATAEKLLAEARQNLSTLTEEMRSFDAKAVEASIARNSAEKKLTQIESAFEARDRQTKDLEQSRTNLVERSNALAKTLRAREAALVRAEEKIQLLSDRIGQLEADLVLGRTSVEKRVEDLNTTLQRERIERAVVEGALEGARKEHARLQREMALMNARRRATLPENASELTPERSPVPESRPVPTVKSIIQA
jgi:chromosome segregation ATPase